MIPRHSGAKERETTSFLFSAPDELLVFLKCIVNARGKRKEERGRMPQFVVRPSDVGQTYPPGHANEVAQEARDGGGVGETKVLQTDPKKKGAGKKLAHQVCNERNTSGQHKSGLIRLS